MPVKINPLKILNDLGYEMVDIESDEDYLSALMEAIVSLQEAGGSGRERADILQEELIRVRKARKAAAPSAGMKVTQKKISTSKFFGKEEKQTAANTTGTSDLAVRSKSGKIDTKKLIPEPTQEKGGVLAEILTGVNSIVDTLKAEKKQDKKHFSFLRKVMETFKRRKKENKLEFKVFEGLKNTVTKVLEPMKSAWSKFIEFVGNILLGNVLFKILNWMGNPENQGKLNSIIKFFEDWWPVLLGGYLIFGNALTGFALGLLKNVVVWGAKLVATVIPALLKAAVALGPWGIAAAAVLGGGIYLATRKKKEPDQGIEESSDQGMEDEGVTTERTSQSFTTRGGPEAEQLKNQMAESRGEETQGFKEGGLVQHYNNATQEASNIIQGFNEGGPVMGYGMGEIMPDQFVFNKTEFKSKSTTRTRNGEVIDHKREKSMTDIGGSIGMPDLIEHQKQLVSAIRKVKGYENINFMDVVQYPNGEGRLVGIPEETLYPILNASDAAKATSAKQREADQRFLVDNDLIRPDGSVKGYSYFGGKLKVEGEEERDANLSTGAIRKFKRGGVVKGAGGVDKVPARLTAGEFVMSKGAVEKYGVNTLAAMNAAGGGTNIPTLMGGKPGYAGGGEVTSYQQLVEKGGVINDHGNVGGDRIVEVLFPPKKKGLFGRKIQKRRALYSSSSELDTPIEDFLNSRLGGSSTIKPKSSGGTGFFKGIGNIFSGKTFSGEERVKPQRGRGQGNKLRAVPSKSGDPNIQPSEKKKNVIRAYEQEKNKMSDSPNVEKSNSEIPQFDVTSGRSAPKIKVLGISV